MEQKRKRLGRKIMLFIAGTATTIAGFILIPPLIDQYGKMLYKVSLKNEEIDFDNMGPEIVKRSSTESQEEEVV